MKRIGIYAIISGVIALFWVIGLVFYSYFRGLANLQQFGAVIYLRDLLFDTLIGMWWYVLSMLAFSAISIAIGMFLLKDNRRALQLWIGLYGLIAASCMVGMIITGTSIGMGELIISSIIIIWSIRVLNKGDFPNHTVQGTARAEPLRKEVS